MAERSLEQPVTEDNKVGGGEEEPGGQQEPTGGHLAVQMPERLTIVMVNAYQKNLPLLLHEGTDRFGDNACLH